MLINRNRNPLTLPDLMLNGDKIEFVNRVVNLGIIMTSNLSWDDQINSQCGKIYGCLKKLNLATKHFNSSIKLQLFKSLLTPLHLR